MQLVTEARRRNPLEPLDTAVRIVFYALVPLLLIGLYVLFFSSSGTFGWHHGRACLNLAAGVFPVSGQATADGLRSGADFTATAYQVCAGSATVGQAFDATLAAVPSLLLFVVALVMTMRLLTDASRNGLYTVSIARRLRALGWTLIAGEVAAVALGTIGSVRLYNELVPGGVNGTYWTPFWHVSWTFLFTGLALLTFARIMRVGVTMREDLDGVV